MKRIQALALAAVVALALAVGACGEDQFAPGTPEPRFQTPNPVPGSPGVNPAPP